MCDLRHAALFVLTTFAMTSLAGSPQPGSRTAPSEVRSRIHQAVTGPTRTMNQAIAAGATATITLQPVPPKTVPASNYPPGSSIVNSTLILGSVPARIWIEGQVTGWAPEILKTIQVGVSGNDPEMDGGGYSGAAATCGGSPVIGAGDITPAMQACNVNADCRSTMSGIASPCGVGEPSRCYTWDGLTPGNYFPAGKWCEPGFQDRCDAQWIGSGLLNTYGMDISNVNYRFGTTFEPGEVPVDFAPSYLATIVLDVPANAKGTYTIDMNETQTFIQNTNIPPQNQLPIAALIPAVIQVVSCFTNIECQDNDGCTMDVCQEGCCTNAPVASWNQATECCNPTNGVQSPIPQSTSCRIGGCSLGGSSGTPTQSFLSDGTVCDHDDPCYRDGECTAGVCVSSQYAGSDCPKVRFISFDPNSITGSTPSAYRVRLVSLHHPDPPYTGDIAADFSAHEDEVRWVGPPATYVESTAYSTPTTASFVQCQPHYEDWSTIGLLHVTGGEIVPSSGYEVQSIAQGLDINVESNYSAPLAIPTARWGDVVIPNNPPGVTVQPDYGDVSAMVDKFRSAMRSISKPRALLSGVGADGVPDLSHDVNFADIAACVSANKGEGYPYSWPDPCP